MEGCDFGDRCKAKNYARNPYVFGTVVDDSG